MTANTSFGARILQTEIPGLRSRARSHSHLRQLAARSLGLTVGPHRLKKQSHVHNVIGGNAGLVGFMHDATEPVVPVTVPTETTV